MPRCEPAVETRLAASPAASETGQGPSLPCRVRRAAPLPRYNSVLEEFSSTVRRTPGRFRESFLPEGVCMAIQKTEKIWHNGKFIAWDDATLHVMSHVVHYGSSVFEGVRCYALPSGPAIFRANEHMQRRIDIPFTRDEITRAMVGLVQHNGVWPCYIRPIVLRGYGEAGVNPFNSPTEVYICNYAWGKYLGTDASQGVDVCISSWTRIA